MANALKKSQLKITYGGSGAILYVTVTDTGESAGVPQNFYEICRALTGITKSKSDADPAKNTELRNFAKALTIVNGLSVPTSSSGSPSYSGVKTVLGQIIYTYNGDDLNSLTKNRPTITKFEKTDPGEPASRELFATWSWKKEDTENYKVSWCYGTGAGVWFVGNEGTTENKQSVYTPPAEANKVRFKVQPIAKQVSKSNGNSSYKWKADWSVEKIWDYRNDPPLTPAIDSAAVTIDEKLNLVLSIAVDPTVDGIDTKISSTNLGKIQFRVLRYDTDQTLPKAEIYSTVTYPIVKDKNENYYASGIIKNVTAGYAYSVICRSVKGSGDDLRYSDWSEESSAAKARAGKITDNEFISVSAVTPTSVRVVWKKKRSAEKYNIRYVNDVKLFEGYPDMPQVEVEGSPIGDTGTLFTIITGIESGFEWFFEIRPHSDDGDETPWSNFKSVYLGVRPDPPTTWASESSYAIGNEDPLTLYWIHNSKDGANESSADVEITCSYDNDEDSEDSSTDIIYVKKSIDPVLAAKTSSLELDVEKYSAYGNRLRWRVRTEGINSKSSSVTSVAENDQDYVDSFLSTADSYYERFAKTDDEGTEYSDLKYGYKMYEDIARPTCFNRDYYITTDSEGIVKPSKYMNEANRSVYGIINTIDCSSFVGLCLMGIPAEESPYAFYVVCDDDRTISMAGNNSKSDLSDDVKIAIVKVDKISDNKYAFHYDALNRNDKYRRFKLIDTSTFSLNDLIKNATPVVKPDGSFAYTATDKSEVDDFDMIDKKGHIVYKILNTSDSDYTYYSIVNVPTDTTSIEGIIETVQDGNIVRLVKEELVTCVESFVSLNQNDPYERLKEIHREEKLTKPWATDVLSMYKNSRPFASFYCETMETANRRIDYELEISSDKRTVTSCDFSNVRPGDLLFFSANAKTKDRYLGVSHVSIVTNIDTSTPEKSYTTMEYIEVTNFGSIVRKGLIKDRRYRLIDSDSSSEFVPAMTKLVSICRPILKNDAENLYETGLYKSDWSIQRMIELYAKPSANVSIYDVTGREAPEEISMYPFLLHVETNPPEQSIVTLAFDVISKSSYNYTDDLGTARYVMSGDIIFSKLFTSSDVNESGKPYISNDGSNNSFSFTFDSSTVNLENNSEYTIKCVVGFDSGLKAEGSIDIKMAYAETGEIEPNASIEIDHNNIVCYIRPTCRKIEKLKHEVIIEGDEYVETDIVLVGEGGEPLEDGEPLVVRQTYYDDEESEYYTVDTNVTTDTDKMVYQSGDVLYCEFDYEFDVNENAVMSVYRKELDGSFTLLMDDIKNPGMFYIIDPHPSLRFSSYRIIAKDSINGKTSFFDTPYEDLGERSLVIQWDERIENTPYEEDINIPERNPWGGSIVKLPYNLDISNSNSIDVENVKYSGRKHYVSYYGTHTGETMSISSEIDKTDFNTLRLLRELSVYPGDVYIREPSGTGYWATVSVTFNQDHLNVIIPVSIDVTRVEGGI